MNGMVGVQRSGRTIIRATTRSLSASTNVTPFSSANGIFIDWIFSSGVMAVISRFRFKRFLKQDGIDAG